MKNNSTWRLWYLSLLLLGFSTTVPAHNKVVVISLGGNEPAKNKVIFITKFSYYGALGGLTGADTKCQADADAIDSKVKSKIFKAWLGPATDPLVGDRQFVVYDLPYRTPNGDHIASSYADLISMNPWPFLKITANGQDVTASLRYDDLWTGRSFNGTSLSTCQNWTSDSSETNANVFWEDGRSSNSYTPDPTKTQQCHNANRFICMEQ